MHQTYIMLQQLLGRQSLRSAAIVCHTDHAGKHHTTCFLQVSDAFGGELHVLGEQRMR
jgi:hypothetical protein